MAHNLIQDDARDFRVRNITAITISLLITVATTLGTLITFAPLMR